jgi:hypothetical protein
MGSSWRTRSLMRTLCRVASWVSRSQARTRRSSAASSAPLSSRSRNPSRSTMASLASASASMLFDLAWREKYRRMSCALAEGTRKTLWPREMKNTAIGSHAGPVGSITTSSTVPGGAASKAAASSVLRLSVVGMAFRFATILPSPLSTRAVCSLAIPRSSPMIRRSSMFNLLSRCLLRQTQVVGTISPRSQGGRLAAAPTHVLQTAPASWTGPLPSYGSSVARPSGGSQNHGAKGLSLPPGGFSSPPPRPAGMPMQPRDSRSVVDPPPGVPYMAGSDEPLSPPPNGQIPPSPPGAGPCWSRRSGRCRPG